MNRYVMLGIATAIGALGCCAGSTFADTVVANVVESYRPSGSIQAERMNPLNALGDEAAEPGVDWPDFEEFSQSTKVPGTNEPFVSLGRPSHTRDEGGGGGGGYIVLGF